MTNHYPEQEPLPPSNSNQGQHIAAFATPNVRIESPVARKIIGNVFGWTTLGLLAIGVVDTSIEQLDLAWFTVPATTIVAGLFSLYQLTITSPNVPSGGFR